MKTYRIIMILSIVMSGVTVHGQSGMDNGIVILLIHGMSFAVGSFTAKSVFKKQRVAGVPPPTPLPTGMYVPSNIKGLGSRPNTCTIPREIFKIFDLFAREKILN